MVTLRKSHQMRDNHAKIEDILFLYKCVLFRRNISFKDLNSEKNIHAVIGYNVAIVPKC